MHRFELDYFFAAAACPIYLIRGPIEVRRCVFDCCFRRVGIVEVRSPADMRQPHIHRRYWHKGEGLERGCRCTAVTVLLLYCCVLLSWLILIG